MNDVLIDGEAAFLEMVMVGITRLLFFGSFRSEIDSDWKRRS